MDSKGRNVIVCDNGTGVSSTSIYLRLFPICDSLAAKGISNKATTLVTHI